MSQTIDQVKSKAKDLKPLFEPKSIAVIGASRRKEMAGYSVLHNLITVGYKGKIYPVNPKADEIEGVKCYPSIKDLPEAAELAVMAIPSTAVPQTLKECAERGTKAAVIISAGFREIGAEGKKLEDEVKRIADTFNIPVLGPNCLGNINTDPSVMLNASFSRTMPQVGNIAFISQSGALCAAILDYAKGENIGFSKFVSIGNKTDITELELLRYLRDDPKTDVILLYVEDLVDGRGFIEAAREITGDIARPKPILAIKSGRTVQGAKAASSHTGSLMGTDEVYDAIFAQAGVLRVDSVSEIFDYAVAFANQPLPKSKRVAIVTNAGGPGIMATDACVRYGLEIAKMEDSTVEALKKVLPPTSNFSNPIDVIGDARADRYEYALKCVMNDPNVDALLIILTPQAMTEIDETARVVVKLAKETDKTLIACFMGNSDVISGAKILNENRIPQYVFPEEAARALGAMVRYRNWLDRLRTNIKVFTVDIQKAGRILEEAKKNNQHMLPIHQAMDVFKAYGFPIMPYGFATNKEEAVQKAREIGFPVVLKIVSQKIIHKFDVGGVKLHLKDEGEVANAYDDMYRSVTAQFSPASIEGVFVQGMASGGREVILGMNRDPHFGPILMFGLGGIYVEALKDVTFRLAPIRELSAHDMLEDIRAFPLLKGVRGEASADLSAISECIERLSQLSCELPLIDEIDINPLLVFEKGKGARVVDARIALK
ncbi:MAG: acetate--CoA ligase [Candidatus Omnitrophica bacterium]|nr:acetate--CoA ligase [Candidatus Omnitrophota bacterium]MDD5671752.1 acetate--CoA ligase [Candidatus Omnitrophota bacterium]